MNSTPVINVLWNMLQINRGKKRSLIAVDISIKKEDNFFLFFILTLK